MPTTRQRRLAALTAALTLATLNLSASRAAGTSGSRSRVASSRVASSSEDLPDDVAWLYDHGFSGVQFMDSCASVTGGGSVIVADRLPVGNGWYLRCDTGRQIRWSTLEHQADDGRLYCVLGEFDTGHAQVDPRLQVVEEDEGDERHSASVVAAASTPVVVTRVSALGIASTWPVWFDVAYDVVDIVENPGGRALCDDVFGVRSVFDVHGA